MPLPGDQHKDTHATTNPFIDHKPHVTEYTAQEIATLQSRLDKQLGPEYISTRPGAGGGKVHYLAAEKVINLANEVFGFNGWSSAIQNIQIDFVDENAQNGKITLGLSAIVRVTLRDGTYHEDIGYGHIENCKGKAAAFEKAKKEAATDAMKRALRNFGNVLGNCLYDKDYLQKVSKLKVAPSRWDSENLHRHRDYAPIKPVALADDGPQPKQEKSVGGQRQASIQSNASFGSAEFEDDFGGNPFDESDFTHPDEVRIDDSTNDVGSPAAKLNNLPQNAAQQRQTMSRVQSMPQIRPPNIPPPQQIQTPQPPQKPQAPQRPPVNAQQAQPNRMPPPPMNMQPRTGPPTPAPAQNHAAPTATDSRNHNLPQQQRQPPRPLNHLDGEEGDIDSNRAPRMPPPGIPEGFVSGRSADMLNQPAGARPPNTSLAFNPHAETPSIRRTQGVNPGKSVPILRQALGETVAQQQATTAMGGAGAPQLHQGQAAAPGNGLNGATTPVRTNFVNPSADQNRRIGMPSAAAHTMQNRGAYKPPTGLKRPPLSDVSNLQQLDGGGEAKKPRADSPAPQTGDAPQNETPNAAAS